MDYKIKAIYDFCKNKIDENRKKLENSNNTEELKAEIRAYTEIIYFIRKIIK